MEFNSIKTLAVVVIIPLVILPLLIVGGAGVIYYQSVLKQNIWNENLAQAKSLSLYTSNYFSSSMNTLEIISDRKTIISAVESRNATFLDDNLVYTLNKSDFYSIYFTDPAGQAISIYPKTDQPPGPEMLGASEIIGTSDSRIVGPVLNESGNPTIFFSVPVMSQNDTIEGYLIGELDPNTFADRILRTQVRNAQYIYAVNSTGYIVAHSNRSIMASMVNYSSVPSVKEVLAEREGLLEHYNPIVDEDRLAAYSYVPNLGWGVVVALPMSVAYQPIYEAISIFAIILIIVIIISSLVALLAGKYLTDPIISLYNATRHMVDGGDYHRYLPVERKDEIGKLSRSFDSMARTIFNERERITEERNRAELYVDIMGHDINNLNQSILANLELISEDENLTGDQRESIESALVSTRGSAGIIDNVRKLQRIYEERLNIENEDINDMILACIKETPRPEGKTVTINYRPEPGLFVKGTALLKEVFCNIIGNSIKYSGDEVAIDITVDTTDIMGKRFYQVAIADTGYGIPDEVKPKIFYRFQRGTTQAHGKGLGLYIVKTLVERFGGAVRVEDRVPGDYSKGAKFIVSLPVCEECDNG